MEFDIHPEIERSSTLPGSFYTRQDVFEALRERVFARSWQWIGHASEVERAGDAHPFELLPGLLDEPLVLVRDEHGVLRCLSNVCTHRGNLVCTAASQRGRLRCEYHGRRFGLDGAFESMPEFEGALDFPSAAEDLPRVATADLGGQLFASLSPAHPFEDLVRDVHQRLGHLDLAQLRYDEARSRDYVVEANWALYVDNYLEGFHVPFVHPGLARVLDYRNYSVETQPLSSLQVGHASATGPVFEPAPDGARTDPAVAAYYYWLFPNTMLNFYPWGLSVNVVQPLAVDRTRVLFRTYVGRPELLDQGAGGALDQVELEDEAVVEQVQRGVRSRLYRRGRYSPRRELAVHHFHRLLQAALA